MAPIIIVKTNLSSPLLLSSCCSVIGQTLPTAAILFHGVEIQQQQQQKLEFIVATKLVATAGNTADKPIPGRHQQQQTRRNNGWVPESPRTTTTAGCGARCGRRAQLGGLQWWWCWRWLAWPGSAYARQRTPQCLARGEPHSLQGDARAKEEEGAATAGGACFALIFLTECILHAGGVLCYQIVRGDVWSAMGERTR